jgi:glycosyltransferase involved in cell wall biosynthesis
MPDQRALLLTPLLPSDRGNGLAMRAGMLLEGLAEQFKVDVIALPDDSSSAFAEARAERVQMLAPAPPDPAADAAALLATEAARERAALRPLPLLCRGGPPRWAAQIAKQATGVDLVVVFRAYLAPLLDRLLDDPDRPALVIDVDEIDSETQRSLGQLEQADSFERLERHYLPLADHVTASSALDARALAERHGLAAATAIPNAIRMPAPITRAAPRTDLLFVGNLSYAPNAEGARWLCESVLPLLDGVTVTVAGSNPGGEIFELARAERVTVVADPADVTPLYATARVAVVPLLQGGGSRLKLIEALAHGLPVVSTSLGVRGQPWDAVGEPIGIGVADQPEAFAAACRRLLAEPGRAGELGARGRALVERTASVERVAPRVGRLGVEAVRRRAGATNRLSSHGRPADRPLLSAALIVRDEQAVLGDCLQSLDGLADEIVVVDTGSTDSTVAIAESNGALVLHQPWSGDFSAPRNVGLAHARGEWILYIDADERLAPLDRDDLQRTLASSPATALRVLLSPKTHATPYFEYRLWRSDPRIRFAGLMHEQVVDAIHAAAREDGRPIADWPGLRLEHVGYDGDQAHKHERNLPLLEAQLRHDPSNIYNWRHLAQVLEALGRPREARSARERALTLTMAEPSPSVDGGLAWAEMLRAEHERGADVTELLELGRERWPDHWLIRWIEAIIALDSGRLTEAEQGFQSLLAVDLAALPQQGIAYDSRIFGEWAHASLGLTHLRAGRNAAAVTAYAQAQRCAPDNPEYTVKRALAQARVDAACRVL